ncbi:hypothetical protein GCM10008955_29200 [Deinococcus malanensis]|uniref:DUF6504 domain-containing protein n=1 Tax=Deinococcus malanensis TaxID=1706855 RepID=A0ABQ2EYM5_9DEIO|nr:DUF6504 family protein [Deinococcus malanensis]GGK33337.1 hypothetical protein GCM10008955_29200 [Deinococcus malanensis]
MRAVQQQVDVEVRGGHPTGLSWNGQAYPVQAVLDWWRSGGRWWLGEAPRDCYLVQAGNLTAELHREDTQEGRWWLARVQD